MNLRSYAHQIRDAAIQAVDPEIAVRTFLQTNQQLFSQTNTVDIVAIGKAAVPMIKAMISYSDIPIHQGIVATKEQSTFGFTHSSVSIYESGHPIPTNDSVRSGKQILDFLKAATADTIVFLISGGSSAIITVPESPMTLAEMQVLTKQLLASGAPIQEINTIRKHLDQVKGGGLLNSLSPGKKIVTLVLSDVVGDDLSVIGSGPTYWDNSTVADAENILKKYTLTIPTTFHETLKQSDPIFKNCQHFLIGNGKIAIDAAAQKATKIGFDVKILSYTQQGEAKDVGQQLATLAHNLKPKTCLLIGGETTVTLHPSHGKGGRNQELVLSAGIATQHLDHLLYYAFGTDGIDGPTDAAGAFFDKKILNQASHLGLDPSTYLARHDSYTFFQKTGGLIKTGPSGTNVGDVIMILTD